MDLINKIRLFDKEQLLKAVRENGYNDIADILANSDINGQTFIDLQGFQMIGLGLPPAAIRSLTEFINQIKANPSILTKNSDTVSNQEHNVKPSLAIVRSSLASLQPPMSIPSKNLPIKTCTFENFSVTKTDERNEFKRKLGIALGGTIMVTHNPNIRGTQSKFPQPSPTHTNKTFDTLPKNLTTFTKKPTVPNIKTKPKPTRSLPINTNQIFDTTSKKYTPILTEPTSSHIKTRLKPSTSLPIETNKVFVTTPRHSETLARNPTLSYNQLPVEPRTIAGDIQFHKPNSKLSSPIDDYGYISANELSEQKIPYDFTTFPQKHTVPNIKTKPIPPQYLPINTNQTFNSQLIPSSLAIDTNKVFDTTPKYHRTLLREPTFTDNQSPVESRAATGDNAQCYKPNLNFSPAIDDYGYISPNELQENKIPYWPGTTNINKELLNNLYKNYLRDGEDNIYEYVKEERKVNAATKYRDLAAGCSEFKPFEQQPTVSSMLKGKEDFMIGKANRRSPKTYENHTIESEILAIHSPYLETYKNRPLPPIPKDEELRDAAKVRLSQNSFRGHNKPEYNSNENKVSRRIIATVESDIEKKISKIPPPIIEIEGSKIFQDTIRKKVYNDLSPRQTYHNIRTLDEPDTINPSDDEQEKYFDSIFNLNNELFFRNTDRKGAKQLLKNLPDGAFLFRPSQKHFLALTVKYKEDFYNLGIERTTDKTLRLDADTDVISPEFKTLRSFTDYFTREAVAFKNKDQIISICLKPVLPDDYI